MEGSTNQTAPAATENRKKLRQGGWLTTALIVVILLIGVGLLLYPTFSDWWNSVHASRAIAGYSKYVADLTEADYSSLMDAARLYNESLVDNPGRFNPTAEETELYNSLLNPDGTGIMGYVEVPSIKVKLPMYHGTSEAVLQVAVGHVEGSSLPIGGPSTHTVLSGHRGLSSARLFTDLNKVKVGDTIILNTLGNEMTYVVDQINTVLPDELDLLAIEEGKDYCTLVTCTPYAVNTHRLLVRGVRVEDQ